MTSRNLLVVVGAGAAATACCAGAIAAWWLLASGGVGGLGLSDVAIAPEPSEAMRAEPDQPGAEPADGSAASDETDGAGLSSEHRLDGQPRSGGTLYLPGGEPDTLDPALVRDVVSAEYVYELFSGLVTLSPDLEVVPDLASDWAVGPDGTVYTFTLRTDARFHDGTPVTASDVAYAIERSCDPGTGSDVAEAYLGDIVGCRDKLAGRASTVRGVSVPDEQHVVLTTDAPKAYFLSKLTYPTSFVLDERQVETDPEWWRQPNGTGAFTLRELVDGERLVLERRPGVADGGPWLDAVHFDLRPIAALTRYENGELDASPVGAADAERIKDPLNPLSAEVVVGPGGLGLSYIGLNTRKPPFDDRHVRRAFSYALDRERLADVVLKGAVTPVDTVLPPGMPGHTPDLSPFTFDPELARAELADSSYGSAAALPPVTLHVSGEGGGAPVAEAVADFLGEALGVEVLVEQTPWMVFQDELREGAYQSYILGWAADYPDPQDFLDVLLHSGSQLNYSGFSDPDFDRLLEEARVETDEDRRMALYREAEDLVLNEAPWVPLYVPSQTWLVAPYVEGFELPAIVRPRMSEVWLAED